MIMPKEADPVFPPVPREEGALAAGCLAIEVHSAQPPIRYSIFEFCRDSQEPVPIVRFGKDALGADLQAPRLLHLVCVGNQEGTLSRPGGC